jgi:hypothetical protein
MSDLIADAITDQYGERCPEYAEGCFTCEAWKQYDYMRGLEARIEALMSERSNLISTKRQQINALVKERDDALKALGRFENA